jgi:hypothetical protein
MLRPGTLRTALFLSALIGFVQRAVFNFTQIVASLTQPKVTVWKTAQHSAMAKVLLRGAT